jgi:hypothetical protein
MAGVAVLLRVSRVQLTAMSVQPVHVREACHAWTLPLGTPDWLKCGTKHAIRHHDYATSPIGQAGHPPAAAQQPRLAVNSQTPLSTLKRQAEN